MNILRSFWSFWYDFIVGDDWRIAAGVIAGLGFIDLTVHQAHRQIWWLLPVMVVIMLTVSLWHAARR
ncbi:MAG TPA: hypothetical protein VII55_03230 [Candidatus Saccharimonadales bacterium]